jgi:hypothetical protein
MDSQIENYHSSDYLSELDLLSTFESNFKKPSGTLMVFDFNEMMLPICSKGYKLTHINFMHFIICGDRRKSIVVATNSRNLYYSRFANKPFKKSTV